jgi:hypothetical protein
MSSRTAEGRSRAKGAGRPVPLPLPRAAGRGPPAAREGATVREFAKNYNVGTATITRATRAA